MAIHLTVYQHFRILPFLLLQVFLLSIAISPVQYSLNFQLHILPQLANTGRTNRIRPDRRLFESLFLPVDMQYRKAV